MIETMKKRNHGAYFRSALSLTLISIAAFSYVDDSDIPMIAQNIDTSGEEIRHEFQAQLDCWSQLLVATGGELDPNKSHCYIIDFKWTGSKWEYQKINKMEGEYTLLDKEGNSHPIERLEVSHATESLGVHIAMDGNFNEQRAELTKKAKDFAEKMRVSQCKPNTALYAYNNCFIKGMEYCMPVTNFTKKE